MIEKLPETQIHSCAKINEKLNEIIDWINDVSALRVTDKQVTANLPNIDAGELAFLSKENTELKDELERTRKALETIRLHLMAAKGRFNFYDEYLVSGIDTPHARFIKEEIEKALEQITALEQKDVK